jgi:hypothetical protein
MPEVSTPSDFIVYKLRVVLRCVSPLIWRRLLVRSDTTIADLHATLQAALGWTDEHLNRFVIHGREYGVSQVGASVLATTRARCGWLISDCASGSGS